MNGSSACSPKCGRCNGASKSANTIARPQVRRRFFIFQGPDSSKDQAHAANLKLARSKGLIQSRVLSDHWSHPRAAQDCSDKGAVVGCLDRVRYPYHKFRELLTLLLEVDE